MSVLNVISDTQTNTVALPDPCGALHLVFM